MQVRSQLVRAKLPTEETERCYRHKTSTQTPQLSDLRNEYPICLFKEISQNFRNPVQSFTTVNNHQGLYAYKRLPFGVASAPVVFQKMMDTVLQGFPGVICFIDDILVSSELRKPSAVAEISVPTFGSAALQVEAREVRVPAVCSMWHKWHALPVTFKDIRAVTRKDKILSKVLSYG